MSNKSLSGIFKKHIKGFGFVILDQKSHTSGIHIPKTKTRSAMHNDRVSVKIQSKRRGGKIFGEVVKILERNLKFVFGPYQILSNSEVLMDSKTERPVPLKNTKDLPLKPGDWVRAKIIDYRDLKAEALEVIPDMNFNPKNDPIRILHEEQIAIKFPKEALKETNELPHQVRPEDLEGRKDLRKKPFVTIDGKTAKDFDDAILVEMTKTGFKLFVAIADVSYYIKESSSLDEEASSRGNSTYLGNFVSPMFPKKLSENLCSLNPKTDRLAMVTEMDFSFSGDRGKSSFYPAVIQSFHRLSYEEIEVQFQGTLNPEFQHLKPAQDLGRILIKKHSDLGALDINLKEISFEFDELGGVKTIQKIPRLFSQKMIEQFMLATNQAVSLFLENQQKKFVYRIHPPPKSESLKNLEVYLKTMGIFEKLSSRKSLNKVLKTIQKDSRFELISQLVLRSLSQAIYSTKNQGHYGLNFPSYTHFTSPIRRYADLTVHRSLKEALGLKSPSPPDEDTLQEMAMYISRQEQRSVKAERSFESCKKARFLKQYLGDEFYGVISSVTSFGLFITLEKLYVDGLVRLKNLSGYWIFNESLLQVQEARTHYKMQLGDPVKIRVVSANIQTGSNELELLEHKGKPLATNSLRSSRKSYQKKTGGRKKSHKKSTKEKDPSRVKKQRRGKSKKKEPKKRKKRNSSRKKLFLKTSYSTRRSR